MDFLKNESKPKIVRTTAYGDQEFSLWELELIHTPLFQRLYNLKQLGYADRVFPDAIHSRLNHVLGVAEVAGRMTSRLLKWLEKNKSKRFQFSSDVPQADGTHQNESRTGEEVAKHLEERRNAVRLVALLHDLTHAAFGHTLEDEVCLFAERHDDAPRQVRFFDALVAQLVCVWGLELALREPDPTFLEQLGSLNVDRLRVIEDAKAIGEALGDDERHELALRLRDLRFAMDLLLNIEFVHGSDNRDVPPSPALLLDAVLPKINPGVHAFDFIVHRDTFMIDLVGNTICADLLDYGRRDATNAGLKVQFDERLIRYLALVSVTDELSPTHRPCIRLAIQFFTDKMRHDVLSEMSSVLKARYLINERVVFHPTKCSAGAMLGTSAQLLGLPVMPPWMQVLGDQEFLRELLDATTNLILVTERVNAEHRGIGECLRALWAGDRKRLDLLTTCMTSLVGPDLDTPVDPAALDTLRVRLTGARLLLWKLSARRYHKLAYRIRKGAQHSGGASDETIGNRYCRPVDRFELERRVERTCNLQPGSVVIHCPRPTTSMKLAGVLVVGADLGAVARLRDVTDVCHEGLEPYQEEIRAIEEMYMSIWQFHAFLDSAQSAKQPLVAWALSEFLEFPNDRLLTDELKDIRPSVYSLFAGELRGQIPADHMREVVREADRTPQLARMRFGEPEPLKEQAQALIVDVLRRVVNPAARTQQPTLPGV